jgi:hypothetical protein
MLFGNKKVGKIMDDLDKTKQALTFMDMMSKEDLQQFNAKRKILPTQRENF